MCSLGSTKAQLCKGYQPMNSRLASQLCDFVSQAWWADASLHLAAPSGWVSCWPSALHCHPALQLWRSHRI